jgi:hypothetical protein
MYRPLVLRGRFVDPSVKWQDIRPLIGACDALRLVAAVRATAPLAIKAQYF